MYHGRYLCAWHYKMIGHSLKRKTSSTSSQLVHSTGKMTKYIIIKKQTNLQKKSIKNLKKARHCISWINSVRQTIDVMKLSTRHVLHLWSAVRLKKFKIWSTLKYEKRPILHQVHCLDTQRCLHPRARNTSKKRPGRRKIKPRNRRHLSFLYLH